MNIEINVGMKFECSYIFRHTSLDTEGSDPVLSLEHRHDPLIRTYICPMSHQNLQLDPTIRTYNSAVSHLNIVLHSPMQFSQHSYQLHPGHITAGSNQFNRCSSSNCEFQYLVFCTFDKPPCQKTGMTQLTVYHTSRIHYFRHTINHTLVHYVTSTTYKILHQHSIIHSV
jgi:hypothetical protein